VRAPQGANPRSASVARLVHISDALFPFVCGDPDVAFAADLEEPGKPERSSGFSLVLSWAGRDVHLGLHISEMGHLLGGTFRGNLRAFLTEAIAAMEARTDTGFLTARLLHRVEDAIEASPFELRLTCGPHPVLTAECQDHRFGVLYGEQLEKFLRAAFERAMQGMSSKVVDITDGERWQGPTPACGAVGAA
jgi:hypothetical protein